MTRAGVRACDGWACVEETCTTGASHSTCRAVQQVMQRLGSQLISHSSSELRSELRSELVFSDSWSYRAFDVLGQ